ncbi:class E sortase [Streptomyces sp. NPDC019396]|uniref:class E sortase n=1 Tax=Streptomyces sp. NPDC019396 TaxID=3154687 RepID=UPI0033D67C42
MPVIVHRWRTRRNGRVVLARGLWALAEAAVTFGVVVLLLVGHQIWWTNRQARDGAQRQVRALEREWGVPAPAEHMRDPGDGAATPEAEGTVGGAEARAPARREAPRWERAYAILRVPRLGLVAPVAEGTANRGVLDKGYVGHYRGTAQPGQPGNFAVAGHRNTHGEPFRYINRLRAGDAVEVETRDAVFTYQVDKRLPQTSARDGGVIAAVPRSGVKPEYGYGGPGYYLTMTTCTPEYTSKYRLVVWGKLASVRPR